MQLHAAMCRGRLQPTGEWQLQGHERSSLLVSLPSFLAPGAAVWGPVRHRAEPLAASDSMRSPQAARDARAGLRTPARARAPSAPIDGGPARDRRGGILPHVARPPPASATRASGGAAALSCKAGARAGGRAGGENTRTEGDCGDTDGARRGVCDGGAQRAQLYTRRTRPGQHCCPRARKRGACAGCVRGIGGQDAPPKEAGVGGGEIIVINGAVAHAACLPHTLRRGRKRTRAALPTSCFPVQCY